MWKVVGIIAGTAIMLFYIICGFLWGFPDSEDEPEDQPFLRPTKATPISVVRSIVVSAISITADIVICILLFKHDGVLLMEIDDSGTVTKREPGWRYAVGMVWLGCVMVLLLYDIRAPYCASSVLTFLMRIPCALAYLCATISGGLALLVGGWLLFDCLRNRKGRSP